MNMFKKFLVAIFATLCCVPAAYSNDEVANPDSAFEADPYFLLMGEADRAIADSDWTVAAARLCDALAVKPDNPANALVLYNLASVYSYMDHDSLAVETFTRALDFAPRSPKLLLGRARTLLGMGKRARAYEDFSTVIDIDSLSTDARFYRGMMSLYAGDATTAEADFNVLASVAPQSFDTAIALGTLYSLTGRESRAVPYLEKLIEHDPAAEYFASLAGCYLALGKLSEASGAISDGLARYPDDPELYYYCAWLNLERFRRDDAEADARKALSLGANPVKVKDLFEHRK